MSGKAGEAIKICATVNALVAKKAALFKSVISALGNGAGLIDAKNFSAGVIARGRG